MEGKPNEIAARWAAALPAGSLVHSAAADASYLNVFLNPTLLLSSVLSDVLTKKQSYGNFTFGAGKKIYCEYSSPNIAKPFHAGHLRSTVRQCVHRGRRVLMLLSLLRARR